MLIGFRVAGVDRRNLDGSVRGDASEVLVDLERAFRTRELAADRGDAHVLDSEGRLWNAQDQPSRCRQLRCRLLSTPIGIIAPGGNAAGDSGVPSG
jgi:hypothetical protein